MQLIILFHCKCLFFDNFILAEESFAKASQSLKPLVLGGKLFMWKIPLIV